MRNLLFLVVFSAIVYIGIIRLSDWSWLSGGWLSLAWALINYWLVVSLPSKRSLWIWLGWLGWVFFWLYSLINLAHYQVFRNFLLISREQLFNTNGELLAMIKDYYYLIPTRLYITLAVFLILSLAVPLIARRMTGRRYQLSLRRRGLSWIIVLALLINNGLALGLTQYFEKNPLASWSDKMVSAADWGLGGNLIKQAEILAGYDYISRLRHSITDEQRDQFGQPQVDEIHRLLNNLGQRPTSSVTTTAVQLPTLNKPNIIIVQLESVSSWALRQNPTPMPFLQSLMDNNISVKQFLGNSCNTINAEYSGLCSALPNALEPIDYSHSSNNFISLAQSLKQAGYLNYVFHSNGPDAWHRGLLYPSWGFDRLFFTPYFRRKDSDDHVLTELVRQLKLAKQPTLAYFVSFTSHGPHNQELMDYNLAKNKLAVTPYQGQLDQALITGSELDQQKIRNYLGFLTPVDDALRNLFANLKVEGLDKNTVVVIYGDHRLYNFSPMNADNFVKYNDLPFVMVVPGMNQPLLINQTVSHIDIAPTLWQLVYGQDKPVNSYFMGTSLFETNRPDGAITKCLGEISYVRDGLIIQGDSRNNLYRFLRVPNDWSRERQEITINQIKKIVSESDQILYGNLLPILK